MLLNPVHIAYRDISDWKPIVSVYKIAIPTSLWTTGQIVTRGKYVGDDWLVLKSHIKLQHGNKDSKNYIASVYALAVRMPLGGELQASDRALLPLPACSPLRPLNEAPAMLYIYAAQTVGNNVQKL
jgi:hypothetical protein